MASPRNCEIEHVHSDIFVRVPRLPDQLEHAADGHIRAVTRIVRCVAEADARREARFDLHTTSTKRIESIGRLLANAWTRRNH